MMTGMDMLLDICSAVEVGPVRLRVVKSRPCSESIRFVFGEVAEWTIASALKAEGPTGPGGSNPSFPAEDNVMSTKTGSSTETI